MSATRPAAVAAALGAVGLVVTVAAIWSSLSSGPAVDTAGPEQSALASSSAPAPVRPAGAARPVTRADASLPDAGSATPEPVRIRVSSIDFDAPIRPVGVATDGQMELPANPEVMGWYRFGPTPGTDSVGSAVIAGHLDSDRFGLGPLVRLRDVQVGDRVEVQTSGGGTKVYVVRKIQRFDRQGLPGEVFSRTGPERIRIITCGGAYLPEAGGYQQNLVVTATPS